MFRFNPFLPRLCCLKAFGGHWKEYKRLEMHLLTFFLLSYPPASNYIPRDSPKIFIRTSIHPNHHPLTTTPAYSTNTPNRTPRNPVSLLELPQATQHLSRCPTRVIRSLRAVPLHKTKTFPKVTVSAKLLHYPRYLGVFWSFQNVCAYHGSRL